MNNSTASDRDAYKASGGKAKTPGSQDSTVSEILMKPEVKAFHDYLISIAVEEAIVTKEYVLKSLKSVAERCMTAEQVMEMVNGRLTPTGEWKFDSSGANKSLDLLGKHLKLFTEKFDIKLPEGVNVIMNFGTPKKED